MARIRDIYDIIDAVAPFSTALDFDNAGLLVGDGNTVVTRALLALDITPAVVAEAASMNANLILSHHPVIFHPLKSLGPQDVPYQLGQPGHCRPVLPHQFGFVPGVRGQRGPGQQAGAAQRPPGGRVPVRTACSFPATWRSPWSPRPSPPW